MLKAVRIPLIFLFIGSLLGVFLRWQFISPTPGTNYTYFLHGHSHIMFMGWIFNILFIAFVSNHIQPEHKKPFRIFFIVLQFLNAGMLVSFPLQGYGFYSILLSTLHTLVAAIFVFKFCQRTRSVSSTSAWYAKIALAFFILSTFGPFSLAYIMSSGLGQSNWYYFSIYFYLHFQYNGFFLFGVLSLFFRLLERKEIHFNAEAGRCIGMVLAVACIPAYLLSVLWAKPGYVFNMIGAASAIVQFVGVAYLIKLIVENASDIRHRFQRFSVILLFIAFIAVMLKMALQLASAFPAVAQMSYELRPVVIAYLHLVLIGAISIAIFAWLFEMDLIDYSRGKIVMRFFILAFAVMEICLVLSPWWNRLFGPTIFSAAIALLVSSILLSLCCGLLLIYSRKLTKVSV